MIGAVSGYTTPKEMKGSVTLMTQRQKALLSCAVAAALLLSGCRKGSSNSGSMSSSNAMSGSSGSASTTQTGGWKTGLGILTEASDEARTGTIHTIAAAVLLDGDGKLADVMLDELEVEVTADGKGVVTMPTDYRTKRQKGDDYPLAAASSLKKGWAEQADDFADYLTGMTPEQASMLETDKDGKAVDADLLSGCTIRVDQYRDAVAKACTNASALGAAKGDRVSLGVEAENASSDITATDDKDVNAEVDLTVVALTLDADGRVTSAIGDMACDILLGDSSPLYLRLYDQGLINTSFGGAFEMMPGIAYLYAGGDSRDARTVAGEIYHEAERLAAEGIDEDFYQQVRRATFGEQLRGLNSFENIAVSLTEGYFRGYDPFRFPQVFDSITKDDILAFLRENLREERAVLSEIVPKNA